MNLFELYLENEDPDNNYRNRNAVQRIIFFRS